MARTPIGTRVPAYNRRMGKRRANNGGGPSQRPNGTWEARLTWVDPDTG